MNVETHYYECLECKWCGGEWQSHEQLFDHQTQEEFPPNFYLTGFLAGVDY
jgi:hypothetical protein